MIKNFKLDINIDILKILALLCMSLDHVAKYLLENGLLKDCFIGIGRTSFPIFSFLLMMHLAKKNIFKKYISRLLVFGVISLCLMILFQNLLIDVKFFPLNILISFLLAVVFLKVCDLIEKEEGPKYIKAMMYCFSFFVFSFLSLVCDYGAYGFFLLICLYLYFKQKNNIILAIILLLSCLINIGEYWFVSFLVMVVLFFNQYESVHKRIINKWWIFYAYYPLHLFIILLIKLIITT